MYYMRSRYYSPYLMRFINADVYTGSIENSPTLNRYAYANGNPINNIDPCGTSAQYAKVSSVGHTILDVGSYIPVVGNACDLVNWYATEGDYVNAALSGASVIPFVGGGIVALKTVRKEAKLAEKTVLQIKNISKTGTIWDFIESTADYIPNTKIPATFKIDLSGKNYINPNTGTNTLWTNSNATEHMGDYISRLGAESWSIDMRSQIILESYSASLNEAMKVVSKETPERYECTFDNWQLGINIKNGVVYHARMLR